MTGSRATRATTNANPTIGEHGARSTDGNGQERARTPWSNMYAVLFDEDLDESSGGG